MHWIDGSVTLPYACPGDVTMGHEIAGVVDAIGPDTEPGYAVGDRVLSQVMKAAPDGRMLTLGFDYDGGWADCMLADAGNLVPIPDSLPFQEAAIIPDAVSTPWAAVTSTAQVRAGEAVGVWGVGGLGAHAVQLLRFVGAAPIIAVDPAPAARERALARGADHALDPTAPGFDEEIRRLAAFDMAGVIAAQRQGVAALRPGGRQILVRVSPEPLSFETWAFMNEGKSIRGHYGAQPHHTVELVRLVELGRIDLVAPSISEVLPLHVKRLPRRQRRRIDCAAVLTDGRLCRP